MIYLVSQQILPDTDAYKRVSVEESLKLLEPLTIVGLDTETQGLDPFTKKLLLLQLGNFDFQIVVDITTVSCSYYKEYLESNRLFIGWNLKFDTKFLLRENIIIKNLWDGFIVEKSLYLGYPTGMHSMSLKSAGHTYCNIDLDKSVRGKIIWSKILSDDIIIYSAYDVKYLPDIMDQQKMLLKTYDLLDAAIFENTFVLPLAYTEYCGAKLDTIRWLKKMQKDQLKFNSTIKSLNDWVCKNKPNSAYVTFDRQGDLFTGFSSGPVCNINWNSSKQVIKLFKELGFNLAKKDKRTGEMTESIEAKIINPQIKISTIAPFYLSYKEAAKVVSTYGQNVLDQINVFTGRIHTNFNQLGTGTSRLSSGGKDKNNGKVIEYLNFQNFPADDDTRNSFVAEKGNKWISCDYAAQESRIIADLSNDKAMLDLFLNGCGDTHSLVAKMAFPEIIKDTPVEEIKEKFTQVRKDIKSWVEFPINYGGDFNTIHQHSGKTMEESKIIYDNYMKGFPGIAEYQKTQRKFVAEHGYTILNDIYRHKAFVYDYDELIKEKASFTQEFWGLYKSIPRDENNKKTPRNYKEIQMVEKVRHYFKRKSDYEKQAIDYRCQGTGAAMFKKAMIYLWEYILQHNLLFIVKICIPAHDEINIEVPEEMADEMTEVLKKCMKDAGAFFCKKLPIPANAEVNDFWVH